MQALHEHLIQVTWSNSSGASCKFQEKKFLSFSGEINLSLFWRPHSANVAHWWSLSHKNRVSWKRSLLKNQAESPRMRQQREIDSFNLKDLNGNTELQYSEL